MFLDPVEGFLTMRNAADALMERLAALRDAAHDRHDLLEADQYAARIGEVEFTAATVDPDNIFEQDAYRRRFADELTALS